MHVQSLKGRLTLLVLAIHLVVGILTVGMFLIAAQGIARNFGLRYAEKHALLDRSRILTPVQRELALARKLADSGSLKRWCRSGPGQGQREQGLEELESFRRVFADHSVFFIVDHSREYYFNNAANEFRGRELRYRLDERDPTMAWYFETMRRVDDFDLHVDASEQLGLVKLWINVIVKDGERKLGMAGTGLELSGFIREIVQSGERGVTTLLLDSQGSLQAHPNDRYMTLTAHTRDPRQRMNVFQLLDHASGRDQLKGALARLKQGQTQVETLRLTVEGRPYLAAATRIQEIGWVTLALVDRSQVVSLRAFTPILGLLLLSLAVTLGLVSWMLNRIVVRPLHCLTESTERIASGEYGLTLQADRQDEIGQLTTAFQRMSATVKDHLEHLEEKVKERTTALSLANARLTESNRQIMDSLHYAHLIQDSLLPKPALLQSHLPDHFILHRPRDIVGGDFHTFFPHPEGFLMGVADCTGHGVPGAFMTMSAGAILEQLVSRHGPEDPAFLLKAWNGAMKAALHQDTRHPSMDRLDNGLDAALVWVHRNEHLLRFAGARLGLWLEQDGLLEEWKGDPHSLGYRRSDPDFTFTNRECPVTPDMACYLLTDGLLDQHGGPRSYSLGRHRLRALLAPLCTLSMNLQKQAIEAALEAYQGSRPQRDDITMIGFRPEPGRGTGATE